MLSQQVVMFSVDCVVVVADVGVGVLGRVCIFGAYGGNWRVFGAWCWEGKRTLLCPFRIGMLKSLECGALGPKNPPFPLVCGASIPFALYLPLPQTRF